MRIGPHRNQARRLAAGPRLCVRLQQLFRKRLPRDQLRPLQSCNTLPLHSGSRDGANSAIRRQALTRLLSRAFRDIDQAVSFVLRFSEVDLNAPVRLFRNLSAFALPCPRRGRARTCRISIDRNRMTSIHRERCRCPRSAASVEYSRGVRTIDRFSDMVVHACFEKRLHLLRHHVAGHRDDWNIPDRSWQRAYALSAVTPSIMGIWTSMSTRSKRTLPSICIASSRCSRKRHDSHCPEERFDDSGLCRCRRRPVF